MNIFLASKSPRRREILNTIGVKYDIIDVDIDEKIGKNEKPESVAMAISFEKGYNASKKLKSGNMIISADTIVVIEDEILGKPKDVEDAYLMLKKLSGRKHRVITGYTIIENGSGKKYTNYVETKVWFKDYDDDLINWYINTGEAFDKAGSYGIQGKGSLLVKKISGDYFNVIGFPISKLVDDIKKYFDYNILIND